MVSSANGIWHAPEKQKNVNGSGGETIQNGFFNWRDKLAQLTESAIYWKGLSTKLSSPTENLAVYRVKKLTNQICRVVRAVQNTTPTLNSVAGKGVNYDSAEEEVPGRGGA